MAYKDIREWNKMKWKLDREKEENKSRKIKPKGGSLQKKWKASHLVLIICHGWANILPLIFLKVDMIRSSSSVTQFSGLKRQSWGWPESQVEKDLPWSSYRSSGDMRISTWYLLPLDIIEHRPSSRWSVNSFNQNESSNYFLNQQPLTKSPRLRKWSVDFT